MSSTGEPPVVLIIDDDLSVRSSLRRLMRSVGYAVHAFGTAKELFDHGRPDGPCCLILDVGLPDIDGLSFQQLLIKLGIKVPIIFLTGRGNIPMSVRAMKAGAVDFLAKPYDPQKLLACVHAALEADAKALPHVRHLRDLRTRYATLSVREREVFCGVALGRLNKQIGFDLGIAEKTIKVHRSHVMEKMGAGGIADLVRMADLLSLNNVNPNPPVAEVVATAR